MCGPPDHQHGYCDGIVASIDGTAVTAELVARLDKHSPQISPALQKMVSGLFQVLRSFYHERSAQMVESAIAVWRAIVIDVS